MVQPRVTAVVVTYRSAQTVGDAIDALRPAQEAGWLRAVVVDNESDDGTAALVERDHPWVALRRSGGNLGFARGNNLGLRDVDTDYVLFLNPDAALPPADLLRMVEFLDAHDRVAVLGPALDNGDGEAQELRPFPTPGGLIAEALGRRGGPQPEPLLPHGPTRQVAWLCGAALLVRRSVLDQLGGFDPRFFLYFEETDLCLRATQLGHEVWVMPSAVACHLSHQSARSTSMPLYHGCIAEHYFPSRHYYLRKHHGVLAATTAELIDVVMSTLRAVARLVVGRAAGDLIIRLRAPSFRVPRR